MHEKRIEIRWRGLGDPGMKLMRVVLFAVPLAILAWQLRSRGVRRHVISLALLACALVCFYFERLRPMVCSMCHAVSPCTGNAAACCSDIAAGSGMTAS